MCVCVCVCVGQGDGSSPLSFEVGQEDRAPVCTLVEDAGGEVVRLLSTPHMLLFLTMERSGGGSLLGMPLAMQ